MKRSGILWTFLFASLMLIATAAQAEEVSSVRLESDEGQAATAGGGGIAPPLPERHFDGMPTPPSPDNPVSALDHSCEVDVDCANQGSGREGNEHCLTGADGISHCYVPKARVVTVEANPTNDGVPHSLRVQWLNTDTGMFETLGFVQAEPIPGSNQPAPHRITPTLTPSAADQIDWNALYPRVHITGCGIVPDATYRVQALPASADAGIESNYSDPVVLPTTLKWGDAVGSPVASAISGGPDGFTNIGDVIDALYSINSDKGAPLVWFDVEGGGQTDIDNFTNVGDVLTILTAVTDPYPFSAPCESPCDCP